MYFLLSIVRDAVFNIFSDALQSRNCSTLTQQGRKTWGAVGCGEQRHLEFVVVDAQFQEPSLAPEINSNI